MDGKDLSETIVSQTPAPSQEVQEETTVSRPGGLFMAVNIMASLIISASMLLAYDHYVAKKFISVDVKGFVEQQQALYLSGKINDEQLKKNYDALASAVQAIPRNRVVLMGDAVLGGVEKIDVAATVTK